MGMKNLIAILYIVLFFMSCASLGVRQSDLDSWVGVPVVALDTHSLFLTVPVVKTITDTGVEIRNYVNKQGFSSCQDSGSVSYNKYLSHSKFNAIQTCSSRIIGCDNIFYIRNGKVIKYKPVGRCYTNEAVRPEPGYQNFSN
jgi:hypothetical protein